MYFAEELVKATGLVVTPGIGFGDEGEGYIRISLVTHDQRFYDVLLRLKEFMKVKNVCIPKIPKSWITDIKNKCSASEKSS
jgi:hypothetical protein